MVSVVQREQNSLFIDVTVTCANPEHAIKIAETIFEVGDDYLVSMFPNAYVKAIENTDSRAVQNYPNTPMTTVSVAFIGGILVFIAAIVITLMDKTIKGEKDFSENYDIPILGNIPNFKAAAREEPDTRRVLKKPNTKVPRMAIVGFQLAKMTSATAIQP